MKIINKKARFNYNLLEKFEAGIELTGAEVKVLKKGQGDLSRAYAKIISGQLFLVNALIPVNVEGQDSARSRRLLVHKRELVSLATKIKAKKLTIVPVKMYTKRSLGSKDQRGRLIKLELALAKAKRRFEKRESIKRKDLEREIASELKDSKK